MQRQATPKLCECGCGQPPPIAKRTNARWGHVKGEPTRYVRGHAVRRADVRAKIAAAQSETVVQPGERFGRLVVIEDTGRRQPRGHRLLRCRCDCGQETIVAAGKLRRSDGTRSCGCLGPEVSAARTVPSALRFLRFVGEETDTGCLPWCGGISDGGYGHFDGGLAHRFAYESAHGPVPEGHHLHHTCRNRACVNAEHLVPLTPAAHNRLHRTGA